MATLIDLCEVDRCPVQVKSGDGWRFPRCEQHTLQQLKEWNITESARLKESLLQTIERDS